MITRFDNMTNNFDVSFCVPSAAYSVSVRVFDIKGTVIYAVPFIIIYFLNLFVFYP